MQIAPMTCCVLWCRQVKGLDGRSGHAARVTVLQHDESQTEDSTDPRQGGDGRLNVLPQPAVSTQLPPAQPVESHPPDPDAEAVRRRAVEALSAAAKQRAFDAWLDLRTRRQSLLVAAASLWTVGSLRGAWALWQAEHRRTASELERADRHAGIALFRRAVQVRSQLSCMNQRQTEHSFLIPCILVVVEFRRSDHYYRRQWRPPDTAARRDGRRQRELAAAKRAQLCWRCSTGMAAAAVSHGYAGCRHAGLRPQPASARRATAGQRPGAARHGVDEALLMLQVPILGRVQPCAYTSGL